MNLDDIPKDGTVMLDANVTYRPCLLSDAAVAALLGVLGLEWWLRRQEGLL
jgi:hypothetical protein